MSAFERLAKPGVRELKTYEPGKPMSDVARELGLSAEDMLKVASNENMLGPSPRAVEAMREAAADMHIYPDGGVSELKRALAEKVGVREENLIFGNGSNELIELLGHVYMGPDTSIVTGAQAFVVYRLVAAMMGAESIVVPMPGFGYDVDALLAAVRPDTRLVFVANPNNPTGSFLENDALQSVIDGVPEDTIVCVDEAYIELLPEARRPQSVSNVLQGRNVIVLRTFSKVYGLAGLRIGYAIAPPACISMLHRVRQPFNVNGMAQAAALAALDDDDHVVITRRMVIDGLAQLDAGCRRLSLETVTSEANFMLIRVGDGRGIFEMMQRQGVIVRPMDGYGLPEFVRVTVGTEAQNARCLAALEDVA